MSFILVIWTVVGFAGTQIVTHERHDWRPIGTFVNAAACEKAAADMGRKPGTYRCLGGAA